VLLVGQAVIAIALMVLMLVHFPAKPETPPSATSVVPPKGVGQLWREMIDAVKNPSFIILILIGGGAGGLYNIWSSMIDIILSPLGVSQTTAGWLGFIMTVAGILGCIVVGKLGDTIFKGRFRLLLVLIYLGACASYIVLTLCLPSVISNRTLIPSSMWLVYLACCGGGLFLTAATPLFYELGAELTYPVPEGTSAGLITFVNNVACLGIIGISPYVSTLSLNLLMAVSVLVATLLFAFMREEYRRTKAGNAMDAAGYTQPLLKTPLN